jgi:hypothetical protein
MIGASLWLRGVELDMVLRFAIALACVMAAVPVAAGEMRPEEARRFVVGKLFAFNCFDGTNGAGRISADGSVTGMLRLQGQGAYRYAALPPGTIYVRGESVCAAVKGMVFTPCFNLVKVDERTFRGSVSGLSFAYCQFTRRGGRADMTRTTSTHSPLRLHSAAAGGSRAD